MSVSKVAFPQVFLENNRLKRCCLQNRIHFGKDCIWQFFQKTHNSHCMKNSEVWQERKLAFLKHLTTGFFPYYRHFGECCLKGNSWLQIVIKFEHQGAFRIWSHYYKVISFFVGASEESLRGHLPGSTLKGFYYEISRTNKPRKTFDSVTAIQWKSSVPSW